ncbi:hypothetical protein H0H92_008570 [Tricholoma furcatifolium]|nr:hypothetical protein H0H92_008570 [Tricholoma furcatifolium]
MVRPRTFFDFTVDNKSLGRVIFELYNDTAPKTAENFRALCTGERGVSPSSQHPLYYKNSTIHRSIQDFMIQGGDFTKFNGTGGESIYGSSFTDEDLERPLDAEGLLCMANKGPNTNNSQFFITLRPCPHLNRKHVVFGRVLRGFEIVQKIVALPVDAKSRPLMPVIISNCGELELRKPPAKPATDEATSKKKSSRRRSRSPSRSPSRSRSRSRSASRSPTPEKRRHRKKKKSKRKHTPSPSPAPDAAPGAPREETEEEYDARLEREEKERIEEARKRELQRVKEKAERELANNSGGVRFKASKKAKKISLNEFLGDSTLGSWADEMETLPNAPAARTDDDQGGRPGDRYGRRDDFLSTRPDRVAVPKEDVPLPTQPPYTAFIGNLAFDLTESELEGFFAPMKTKSVKIIKDREDKPKGFGYIEFEDLDGLKDAIAKSGSNFSGRTVRVSVAEPPKERSAFGGREGGGHAEDDAKFENPWRRDGPLPDLPGPRDTSRRRFDGAPPVERLPSVAEGSIDWRADRPVRPAIIEEPRPPRRASGFSTPEGQPSAADQAETWTRGSKLPPSAPEEKFGSVRGRGDMGPPKEAPTDEIDWRARKSSISPASSTPPTPQLSRRKLELLPRSTTPSAAQTPLSSPKIGPTPNSAPTSARANPFGAARPVDSATKDKEVTDRLDKEKEVVKERIVLSRTNSRQASERTPLASAHTPPTSAGVSAASTASPKAAPKSLAPNVRPTLSFANAAAAKKDLASKEEKKEDVEKAAEKVAEVEL